MVPLTGLEPVLWKPERDFKSRVSTNSTIAAYSIPPMEGYEVGGMCWKDVPTQRKIKLKKLAVCKHNSDWVLRSAHGILSAKTHSERSGIRLHQNESISYASSCIFLIFQSFFTQKLFVCLYFWEFFQNSLEHKFDAIFEPLEGCLEGCWRITL